MADERPPRVEILRPVINEPSRQSPVDPMPTSEPLTWWERYSRSIVRLPQTTRTVLEDDARFIAERAIPSLGESLDVEAFGSTRVRTGIVVGSVQSGKTASMLAVAALLLDRGIDILVVLAGTRVALWLQTYERLLQQLDGSSLYNAWQRNNKRVLVPQPEDILANEERVDPLRYLNGTRHKVKDALASRRPIIYVIPKEDDHLLALARFLSSEVIVEAASCRREPLTMVVLDDEADDASILDAREGSRITPQFIQYLWSSDEHAPYTRHDHLFATYIAYTATPQANYLQHSHNPLTPRSFHAALRTPSDRGARSPRTTTFHEKAGLSAYYCGGDIFYERLRDLPGDLCISRPFPNDSDGEEELAGRLAEVRWRMIGDAMRAFFVSGAVRLYMQGRRLSNVPTEPTSLDCINQAVPATHSMLYHPSALKEMHFAGAEDIVRWSRSTSGSESGAELPVDEFGDPILALDPVGLALRLEAEEPLWRAWLTSFGSTASGLASIPGSTGISPATVPWSEVRTLLLEEVFPHTKLRVLNSDPRADDRPRFEPVAVNSTNDRWNAPRDLYTIFVAGNVLSRGLTVEGLCTSLFLRSAREPASDTQMQMQRWFGYRGSHLPYCRVFLFEDQLELFRQYHRNDVALKTEILNHMDGQGEPFTKGVLVLQGSRFKATGKVDSQRVPLHPGATPAIRLIEPPQGANYENNLALVESLILDGNWQVLEHPAGVKRGLIRTQPISMLEVAEILERLRYSIHDPDPQLDLSQRWVSLQRMLNLENPLFRPPGIRPGPMAVDPAGCPYTIAAYLRLWDVALTRRNMPGMQPTDNPAMPWNMINLASYRASVPRFYVGIRFGSERKTSRLSFQGQSFPMMRRGIALGRPHMLETLWGSRNPTERWRGDQVFDYHYYQPNEAPRLLDEGAWRVRGQPGLVLFHPIVDPATGREMIAVGLAIPHGGPDHIAALRVRG